MARSGLFVEVEVRSIKAKMLVDTGATDTILSSTLYHRIPGVKRPHLNTSISGVRNADGSELSTLGSGWVELRVGACISSLQVVFGNTGSMDGILGMDFLLQHQANLDLKTKELNLNGERIKCTDGQGTSFCARVVVGETTRVPAGHEALISGHVKSNTDRTGFGLIEPAHNELTRKGILVGTRASRGRRYHPAYSSLQPQVTRNAS